LSNFSHRIVSSALVAQYGGFLRSRCALAACVHHARSSAKRGNAPSSASPGFPVGSPLTSSVSEIGPTESVLETTTIPISDKVPCQVKLDLAPAMRPAE